MSIIFLSFASSGFAQKFKEIIAFGDSLTDVGNVAGITIPGFPPVINGYYQETHFSDNVIWIEILANYLGLPVRTPGRGNSTVLPPQNGNTWAWGGSEAAAGSVQPSGTTEPVPNLLTEVDQYLAANTPDKSTLYTIWSGADNLLVSGDASPQAARKAVRAVATAIRRLNDAGARYFLIFNLPKLGDTPFSLSERKINQIAADIYSSAYNRALKRTLTRLRIHSLSQAKIYSVDIYSEFVRIVMTVNRGRTYVPRFFVPGDPVAINNVMDQGISVFEATGTFPSNYLFWDDVHPTTQGHQVVAGLVLKALSRHKFCRQHHSREKIENLGS